MLDFGRTLEVKIALSFERKRRGLPKVTWRRWVEEKIKTIGLDKEDAIDIKK